MKGFKNLYKSEKEKNKKSAFSKKQIINQAIKLHKEGDISEATKYYQKIIKQGYDDPTVFSNYGLILKSLGKLKEAEISTRKALELNPNYATAHCNLGGILKDIGKLKEAEISTRKALELNPNSAIAYCNLGGILKDIGKLNEAEISTRKALELNPNYAIAHCNLGGILKDIGKLNEAEISTRKALELNPNSFEAHCNLGNILSDIGNFNEAEISTRKAIELKPDFSDAYYNLGNILKDIGRFKDAELSYRKAIELKPDFVDAYYNLGNILKDIGKLKGAELSYRKAIGIKPNFSKAYFALSLIIINVKNDNLLRYLFSKEILENKENIAKLNQADIYFARGNILERKEDYKESYKMFRKANLITRKKFKSNFKIFIEVLEQDNFLTKEIEEIPKPEDKDRDLPTPIFTVGLPRAGKSTIESILSKNNSLRKFGDSKGISAVVRDYKNIAESCQVLGISINSTFKEIRTAYLSLAKQYHPDKGGDEELMAKIAAGYNFLKNEYEDKVENYTRPNLFRFFIQKLGEDLAPFDFTCHTSPNNILYTGLIASQIPKSKIIYCYRNPKDHIIELYKYNLQNYLTLKTSIIHLAKTISIIDDQMNQYRNRFYSKIYFLNFDQLILEPKREIKLILNWLNWKYDDKYLTPKLLPKGNIQSRNDFNSFNSSYLNQSKNYTEQLKPIEGILSKLLGINN